MSKQMRILMEVMSRAQVPITITIDDVDYLVRPEMKTTRHRASGAQMVRQAARGRPINPYDDKKEMVWRVIRKHPQRFIAMIEKLPNGMFRSGQVIARTIEDVVKRLVPRTK